VVVGLAVTLAAQEPDYLTREEVELVREAQDPNKRVPLFLKFAGIRMTEFELALAGEARPQTDAMMDLLNNYIRAVDDTSGALQDALDRGGVDMSKTRKLLEETGKDFLSRLEKIQEQDKLANEEFRWDMEDALQATQDLLELAAKIPEGLIPPKMPVATGESEEEPVPPPGKPTLKKKRDEPPK
jgi:hypothetical protein